MPDLAAFPVQGKLRMRQDNFVRDAEFIAARVGYLSTPVLKSVPGYDFLKFWYADFAATQAQWATLGPEVDKRNILVTLYEAPVLYMEALTEEQEGVKAEKLRGRSSWVYYGAAAALIIGILLRAATVIDVPQCLIIGLVAIGVVAVGQVHSRLRG